MENAKLETFTASNGTVYSVRVCLPYGNEEAPAFEPPHTITIPRLAYIDMGENFHGDMREDFYLVTNASDEPTYLVLWLGSTGSQDDDSVGRLYPVAWHEFEYDENGLLEKVLAEALFFAHVRSMNRFIDTYSLENTMVVERAGLQFEEELCRGFRRAVELGRR